MGNSILFRMPSGIAGDVSRKSQSTIEPQILGGVFVAFGLFGQIDSMGKFVPISDGDDIAVCYGLNVRAYPTTSSQDPLGKSTPAPTGIADVMRRGYMTVKNNAGTAVNGAPVYVRMSNATSTKPLGGIEAVASAGTVKHPSTTFMNGGDADGNVEIAYNV